MKRAFAIAAVAELLFVMIVLHAEIKDFLWTHPWWRSFLAALPAIAVAVFAYFEWRHSDEVSELSKQANGYLNDANGLREENNKLHEEANELRKEANREKARANAA